MRFLLALATLSAQACSPCAPSRSPTLEIGTGERGFASLNEDEPSFELVYGPQGGWHVVLAFAATGLSVSPRQSIATIDAYGEIEGETVASIEDAWGTFACDREVGAQVSWNTFLIFDVLDPSPLHRARLDVQAFVTDPKGRVATSTIAATILDPTRED